MDDALKSLRSHPKFGPLIRKHGPPQLKRGKNPFQALCRSIINQQISGKAAASIYARFVELFNGTFPTPEEVLAKTDDELRSVGLSTSKRAYIRDLAQKFADGTIRHRALRRMTTPELIEHLTQVKGIGVWTVHMFLIFTLNRLDVLPTGDLGIRKGFKIVYGLKELPTPTQMERLARDWRTHASVASWYLWRAADDTIEATKYRPAKSRPRAK